MFRIQALIVIASLLTLAYPAMAQPKIIYVKKLLHAENDTVMYSFTNLEGRRFEIPLSVGNIASKPGKLTMMNNNNTGWTYRHTYKTRKDSITLTSRKQQSFVFKATNGKDTVDIYANFVNAYPKYTKQYIKKHSGAVTFEIPQAFELVNIIFAISDAGKADGNLILKGTKYYDEVMKHFNSAASHPVVHFVNSRLQGPNKMNAYYDGRTHSIGYEMNNNHVSANSVYPEKWGQSFWTKRADLLSDFAKTTDFASFYKSHKFYYDSLIRLQKRYLPVDKMWHWLESEFPGRYDSYKIIFSPLINGAHNTDQFSASGFSEVLMYICGPERIKEKDHNLLEGLMSAILFTEIDHNYVNPVSDKYADNIKQTFSDRSKWTGTGGDAWFYNNPTAVFNEYMTHALFVVYAYTHFDAATFNRVKKDREELMVNVRKFIRFKMFNDKLMELYLSKPEGKTVAELLPEILVWAKTAE